MKMTRSATSRAKPISWVTTNIVHTLIGQSPHDGQHLADEFRSSARRRFIKQDGPGFHRHARGDCDALLLTSGEAVRISILLFRSIRPGEQFARLLRAAASRG